MKVRYKTMKVLSLFDGISCGMVALERAGIPVERYVAYEIEPNAIKISKKNYPQIEQNGDVFKAEYKPGKFDLLIGGSPCTYWSIARTDGKRELSSSGFGWELFMQYVRALREAKPTYFLYENNNSMNNLIKEEITKQLGVQPIMIDSGLVSAQNRRRLYWTNIPNVKQPDDKGIVIRDIIEPNGEYNFVPREKLNNQVMKRNYLQWDINGKGNGSQDQRAYFLDGKCGTLDTGCATKHKLLIAENTVRTFTQTELERLQTLPDGYTKGVSKNIAGKGVGNGWTVDVIAHILKGVI
jgi:DNA (cytosine-5)-methyltransferase 3A